MIKDSKKRGDRQVAPLYSYYGLCHIVKRISPCSFIICINAVISERGAPLITEVQVITGGIAACTDASYRIAFAYGFADIYIA